MLEIVHRTTGGLCLQVKHKIKSFNVLKDSGLSCHPKPITSVLSPEALIPANLYIPQETAPVTTNFAPKEVIQLFRSSLYPKFFMTGTLPHENAFACTLLTWHIAKTAQGSNSCWIGLFKQAPRASHTSLYPTFHMPNPSELNTFRIRQKCTFIPCYRDILMPQMCIRTTCFTSQ